MSNLEEGDIDADSGSASNFVMDGYKALSRYWSLYLLINIWIFCLMFILESLISKDENLLDGGEDGIEEGAEGDGDKVGGWDCV